MESKSESVKVTVRVKKMVMVKDKRLDLLLVGLMLEHVKVWLLDYAKVREKEEKLARKWVMLASELDSGMVQELVLVLALSMVLQLVLVMGNWMDSE